jgi:hypothetical protein
MILTILKIALTLGAETKYQIVPVLAGLAAHGTAMPVGV